MRRLLTALGTLLLVSYSTAASADHRFSTAYKQFYKDISFKRIATFANYTNNPNIEDETVSEIVTATEDGRTLIYTDSELEELGFVDISNPYRPQGSGKLPLNGEPTSAATIGNRLALVAIDTSESFTSTSGQLVVVDIASRQIERIVELGGQPDSVAVSPDQRFIAVAIENERDEDLCIGGSLSGQVVDEDDCEAGGGLLGNLPQTEFGNPPGFLVVIDRYQDWQVREVDLTGLAAFAPEDPEPEFVDINRHNQAVVSLQENNHIAIVDLYRATVTNHFSAGTVALEGVDNEEDRLISLTDSIDAAPREPDAVAWVPRACGRKDGIATANEGDLGPGTRGFTIFCQNGKVRFDAGTSFEELAVSIGHYDDERSGNRGVEPEAVEFGRFGRQSLLFVGAERSGFVGVYDVKRGRVSFEQALPAPLRPEGVLAIPRRGLLVVSGEDDDPSFGVRSTMMIYQRSFGEPVYPQIASEEPIGFSALSGMTAIPWQPNKLLAVWDSFYAESNIFTIDTSRQPAIITDATTIVGRTSEFTYDPEGIAIAPDHSLWIASEGDDPGSRPNLLVQVDGSGNVLGEFGLPEEIEACRLASEDQANLDNGFEGVAVLPKRRGGYLLLVAQQLPWFYTTPECADLDDDPGFTRIWVYDPQDDTWGHIAYELKPTPEAASFVGLSEITRIPGTRRFVVIERDNRTGDFAEIKDLVRFTPRDLRDRVISDDEKDVFDMLPALNANNGWITDKPEGIAINPWGSVYMVTDNDGLDDWSGETWFLKLGNIRRLFRPQRYYR